MVRLVQTEKGGGKISGYCAQNRSLIGKREENGEEKFLKMREKRKG